MHDISFANKIITLLKQEANVKKPYKSIVVNVVLGAFSHVSLESLSGAFAMLSEKEGFKNVSLNIEKSKPQIKCNKCSKNLEISGPVANCPLCGKNDFELLNSEEFIIKSIEIDT